MFAPLVMYSSVRTLLAFAVQEGMIVHHMDVVTAFLNGVLDEEIYMVQPTAYIKDDEEHLVSFMESANFEQSNADPCLFIRRKGAVLAIITAYVDDLIIVAKSQETMSKIKYDLSR